jgi:hypothetical protein
VQACDGYTGEAMNSMATFIIALASTFGFSVLGSLIATALPKQHLSGESKDFIKLGAGVIATLTALVLGLLLGSAKSSYDNINSIVIQNAARIISIDGALRQYGPEAGDLRVLLQHALANRIQKIWPNEQVSKLTIEELDSSSLPEVFLGRVRDLKPTNDSQRLAQSFIIQLTREFVQNHHILIEQSISAFPPLFQIIMLCWMASLFGTYGLFCPRNPTVFIVLLVCALSVSSAVFLINELFRPFDGLIRISGAPMLNALQHLAR